MKNSILILIILLFGITSARLLQTQFQNGPLSKCQQDCNNNIECLKQCEKKRQYTSKVIATIAGCIISTFLVFCGCCLLLTHKRFRKFRLNFDRKYQAFKNEYNKINDKIMSKQEFNTHANFIIDLFNDSETKDNFISVRNGRQIIGRANISIVKGAGFLCKIQLRGLDVQGNWAASGSIVCTDEGVICWFVKQYNDINWRTDDKTRRFIYKSKPSNLQRLQGTFFNLQEGSQKQNDGHWKLIQLKSNLKHSQTHVEMM